jgi:hypothetical protein
MRGLLILTITLMIVSLIGFVDVSGQVRSSNIYQIQSDSINFGGGLSTSTSYSSESTFGEIATGVSTSSTYSLRAGYQQMQSVYLSLTGGTDVAMNPSIPGVTGGVSNGSTTFTVVTDSPSGYKLTIESSATPAMRDGVNTIADYDPVGSAPDRLFITDAGDSQFGFSPHGNDVIERFKDDGTLCDNGGANNTVQECWDGLSTTAATIVQSSSPNQPTGATTTVYFRVGIGGSVNQTPGSYVATSTITLLAL